MIKILPYEQWDEEDKQMAEKLKTFVLEPIEAYHIAWALFHRYNEIKDYLEKMSCKVCWQQKNYKENYDECKKKLEDEKREMERIVKFFSPYHNRLGVEYD